MLNLLASETSVVLNWFRKNEMKSNDDKYHLIVASKENLSLDLECDTIESSNTVKLLGVYILTSMSLNSDRNKIKNCIHLLEARDI